VNETLIIEAVRKTVTVDCSVEEAFRVFTAGIRSWWPTATHSIHGEKLEDLVFEEREGGEVYELSEDGQRARWATILAFEPPSRLVLSWEVSPNSLGTEVEVRFAEEGAGTRVELEHRGWDSSQTDARASYDTGWDYVLGHYTEHAG
jgi:uncharacterized protein YndB with AHSA1/START domain